MTFTRLTRQQKDVRNEKCREEEECTICVPTTGLSCQNGQSYNAGAKIPMTGPSITPLCSNNTWTFQDHEQADQDTSQLTLRRSICCFVVQLVVPFEMVCTAELIVLCLCQPKSYDIDNCACYQFQGYKELTVPEP